MAIFSDRAEPRFSNLLRGNNHDVWDSIVFGGDDFVVTPTKGSIVSDWVLVIPKQYHLNFALKSNADGSRPFDYVAAVAERLGVAERVIWFEHGPSEKGSDIGCGVDHAHIHLLLMPQFQIIDFAEVVAAKSEAVWHQKDADRIYGSLDGRQDYYVFGTLDTAFFSLGASLGRQFFRKVIADLANVPTQWDYNAFPFTQNVQATLKHIRDQHKRAA